MTVETLFELIIEHCADEWEIELNKKDTKTNETFIEFWGITKREEIVPYFNFKVDFYELTFLYDNIYLRIDYREE